MSEDVPEDANEHCPGTQSERAGKSSACDGCPNQAVCASGEAAGPDPDVAVIVDRLGTVKHKILVLSGKGGVGKSTFSTQFAFMLAAQGYQVGLLDVDVCGPSVPRMMGLEGEEVHESGAGWTPVYVEDNLAVMSIGFLLAKSDDAVIWRGPRKNGLIKRFLKDVDWGDLDYLIVDTPPGTSDEHLSITGYLNETGIDGAVVVTSPQEVALIDVRKELNFCKKTNVNVLGVVENMAGFVCPKCTKPSEIFRASASGGAQAMASEFGVPYLGAIPLDPRLGRACEQGESFTADFADSPAAIALKAIAEQVVAVTGEAKK